MWPLAGKKNGLAYTWPMVKRSERFEPEEADRIRHAFASVFHGDEKL